MSKTPTLYKVVWTGENNQVIDQVACTEEELAEVLNAPLPEGAVVREPVYQYTGIPSDIRYWRRCEWVMPPGDTFDLWINQGNRPAVVLAAIGTKRLIEYEMPNKTTALRLVDIGDSDSRYRTMSYRSVPIKWLDAIVAAGTVWSGYPQKDKHDPIPDPAEMLRTRREHAHVR